MSQAFAADRQASLRSAAARERLAAATVGVEVRVAHVRRAHRRLLRIVRRVVPA